MKRLLAYLFIVLGLGLTFSANADATAYCLNNNFKSVWKTTPSGNSCGDSSYEITFFQYEELVSIQRKISKKLVKQNKTDQFFETLISALKNRAIQLKIVQQKPSQTQKVAKKKGIKVDLVFCSDAGYKGVYLGTKCPSSRKYKISYNNYLKQNLNLCYLKNNPQELKIIQTEAPCNSIYDKSGIPITHQGNGNFYVYGVDIIDTQIAKAEPSQMQKVAKAINTKANTHEGIICVIKGQVILPNGKLKYDAGYASLNIYENKNKSCANINNSENISYKEYLKVLKNPDLFLTQYGDLQNKIKNKICINNKTLKINNSNKNCVSDESELLVAGGSKDVVFLSTVEKKIALKPKKKVKVAKVKDSTQEEFKPKKTNQDNEAPVIEIAEAITVNDTSYEIEGKVVDKSKKLFVQIDGETIPVKKGKFKIKRFSPVDEQLQIVALDQWGNKSKPKLVNITIDLNETELAEKLEQLNPSLIKSRSNKNRVALIIGIEKYEQTPAANFANLDAQYFYEYARKGFGIPKSNIKLLVDENADLVKSISSINKWLPSKIKKNKTELIIFFAGHGLASNNGQELYILPQDSDPDLLSRTALSRTELFEQIISLNPKSVTMFMDTCYSGISRDEQMLLASARPIRIVADDEEGIPDNFTIFTASKLDQISSGLKEVNHGIFSYYLMKGLEGKADTNKDKKITNGELLAYMDENVSQKASELGRQQNPSLAGDPDKILMSYR